jgi:4-phosphopantoate--beta-alanine ligase
MNEIPDSHPRAKSLRLRERLVEGLHKGVVTESGLVAHGRGEALDYLLGEQTHPFAARAIAAASALLTLASHPVITLNGNVAALIGPELAPFAANHPRLVFEVNIFHYTPQRAQSILAHLREQGMDRALQFASVTTPAVLPGLDSQRRFMHPDGVGKADVVLIPLEDGDRCEALVASGRRVIAIDLNPLSRTAVHAHITIVDELTRAIPALDRQLLADRDIPRADLERRLADYNNEAMLREAVTAIRSGFADKSA